MGNLSNLSKQTKTFKYSTYVKNCIVEESVNVGAIVERIKEAYGFKRLADVARKLGLAPRGNPIEKAIQRNSINLSRVVEACSDLNQDWLIWGRGPMRGNAVEIPMGELPKDQRIIILNVDTNRVLTPEEYAEYLRQKEQKPAKH